MKKTLSAKQWVQKNLNLQKLQSNVKSSIIDAYNYNNVEDNQLIAYVEDFVSGSYGHYQSEKIAELFGFVDFENDEWLYEEISSFANEISEEINKQIRLTGNVFLGNLDADGSYGMFYTIELEDFKKEYAEAIH